MHSRQIGTAVAVMALLAAAACGSGGGSGSTKTVGPVNVGEIFALTGNISGPATKFLYGAQIGVADVNSNGGVLGKQITEYVGDDSNDAVDAVPAMRQLLTHNITFLVGPLSPTFPAVKDIVDQAQVPDFAGIPSSAFDSLHDKWVYRMVVSDSVLGTGMAYYAIQKGYTQCSFIFENIQSAQGLVQPIMTSYTAHGGKVLDNESVTPHASSYRSEIEKAFANNPQCIFAQTDATTSGTLFTEMKELGHLNVPIVGTDQYIDPQVGSAIGYKVMNQWVTGMSGAPPQGPSFSYFSNLYQAKHNIAPVEFAAAMYDAVIIGSLAIDIAGTTDRHVWVNDIEKVTGNEKGTECTNYKDCYALVKQGKTIDYEGASGPVDFDEHHSVYAGLLVDKFDASGNLTTVLSITPDQLKGY